MKKCLAILLAAVMLFSLAACGGKDGPKPSGNDIPNTSQPDNDAPLAQDESQSPDDDYEVLKTLGLENTVPKSYTSFKNSYEDVSRYSCDYYFTVPVAGDAGTERMEYTNQVIEAVWAISDDGKSYESTYIEKDGTYGWVETVFRTESMEDHDLPYLYFYKDGMVLGLAIYDYGSDSEHNYNIVMAKEADDYIQR